MSEQSSDQPVYRTQVWEADDGWHWRVEIDVRNGRAWTGVEESMECAISKAAHSLLDLPSRVAP